MAKTKSAKKSTHPQLTKEQVAEALPLSIVRARETVMSCFRTLLRKYGLTEPQWRVIWTIESLDEVEMTELSRMTALLFPSLSRIVRELEQRDYIKRRPDPTDMRRMLISLNERGAALFELVAPECRAVYRGIRDAMGTEKLHQLQSLLVELDERVSTMVVPTPKSVGLPDQLSPAVQPKTRGRPRKMAAEE
ncbi:homoprotocatechuate degradation regulator HpaR [Amorphus suaedae]